MGFLKFIKSANTVRSQSMVLYHIDSDTTTDEKNTQKIEINASFNSYFL